MTEFDERLQNAIARGKRKGDRAAQAAEQKAVTEEELKRLHSQYRLQLSEHIESCMQKLPQYFPGFQFETLFGDRGWGAACSRDDIQVTSGRRDNFFSRLELTVRPYSQYHVVDLAGKGTVRNREIFSRSHYAKIVDVDPDQFLELIDRWVLEFAELFSAHN